MDGLCIINKFEIFKKGGERKTKKKQSGSEMNSLGSSLINNVDKIDSDTCRWL